MEPNIEMVWIDSGNSEGLKKIHLSCPLVKDDSLKKLPSWRFL